MAEPADSHDVWTPESTEPAPVVIVAGDLMSRDGKGIAPRIGPALAAKGYVVIAATPSAHRDTKEFTSGTLSRREQDIENVVTGLFERVVAPGRVASDPGLGTVDRRRARPLPAGRPHLRHHPVLRGGRQIGRAHV